MGDYSPSLQEAIDAFLRTVESPRTAETYRWALRAFRRFLAATAYRGYHPDALPYPVHNLADDVMEEFHYWLTEHYTSQQTRRTYLSAVRRFLTWLDARDLLSPSFQLGKAQSRLQAAQGEKRGIPYKPPKVDPELPSVIGYYDKLKLPPESGSRPIRLERLKILRARAVVHTLYASGGRVSEVAGLTREMVLDGRLDEVHTIGKGGQPRVILLTTEAMQAIQAYVGERGDEFPGLFISHGRGYGKALGRGTIWSIVKRAAKALGLHHSTSPHSFRHFRATQLLNEGMPLESVQAYLGHQDISTTRKVYAHTQTAVLRDQLATFGRSPAEALEDLAERRRKRSEL
jgi:site-specific recombinase XerD